MLNDIYGECMAAGGEQFAEFEALFCQATRARGGLLRENLHVAHFYPEHFKTGSERYLN